MWKFLILSEVSMSAIVSFGSCNVILMGGREPKRERYSNFLKAFE